MNAKDFPQDTLDQDKAIDVILALIKFEFRTFANGLGLKKGKVI